MGALSELTPLSEITEAAHGSPYSYCVAVGAASGTLFFSMSFSNRGTGYVVLCQYAFAPISVSSAAAFLGSSMSLYVSQHGIRVPRLLFLLIATFVSVVLTLTMLPAESIAADEETTQVDDKSVQDTGSDTDGNGDLDRPDTVSAAVTARLVKKPVEDLSKRTETTRTLVNPDGTLTDEDFGTAVRVQDKAGAWQDVDYDLAKLDDGSFAPKFAAQDVSIAGGDAKEAARLTLDDGTSLAVSRRTNCPMRPIWWSRSAAAWRPGFGSIRLRLLVTRCSRWVCVPMT